MRKTKPTVRIHYRKDVKIISVQEGLNESIAAVVAGNQLLCDVLDRLGRLLLDRSSGRRVS